MFSNTWVCDFPWVESIVGDDGLVTQVQCTICNKIEGKAKMLVLSLTHFKSMPIIEKKNSIFMGSHWGLFLQPRCYTLKNEKIFCGQNYEFIMIFI